jgi:hypothetical protein
VGESPAFGEDGGAVRTGQVRAPVAAGTFYPGDAAELTRIVEGLLVDAKERESGGPHPSAVIVPHAGYRYSGPVAASAYALLRPAPRVVILGPSHFLPFHGIAVPTATSWVTPLGEVAIDAELREEAVARGAVVDDGPHELEHAIEVQLPFLQTIRIGALSVLPVAVGTTEPGDVAGMIEAFSAGPEVTVIVSTDLSHYYDAETARTLDRRTADAVLALDPRSIRIEDACGVFALRGIVEYARVTGREIRLLDLRNSADMTGHAWRVVGYGAFVI